MSAPVFSNSKLIPLLFPDTSDFLGCQESLEQVCSATFTLAIQLLSLKHNKIKFYLQPTIIMATEKIFSPSVVGAMFPNPIVVRLVMVK